MCLDYADNELERSLVPGNEPRPKFKYVDGIQRLADLPLPFLVDLPNGSSEAVFLIASRNAASGLVPILEKVYTGSHISPDHFPYHFPFWADIP